MTGVYITIDTEYASSLAGLGRAENFARSIAGETPEGPAGVFYKMRLMERCGLKGVFFVDPMPALIWGVAAIEDVVGPIVEHGHDVQLHLHTEWLAFANGANPLPGRSGANLKDFTFEEQCILIDYAALTLGAAGAPRPVAFRAGNYGANDDTLRALDLHACSIARQALGEQDFTEPDWSYWEFAFNTGTPGRGEYASEGLWSLTGVIA